MRLTGDVDFFYGTDAANAERLFAALLEFWDGDVPGLNEAGDLRSAGQVVQFGRPPNRIDLLNDISGVRFEEAWRTRQTVAGDDGTTVHVISLPLLIANKEASGRPKDLGDVAFLRAAADREGKG